MGRVVAKVETTRMVMNIPLDLLAQLDNYASRMCINRTSAVCVLLNQALNNEKAIADIAELLKVYQDEQAKQSIKG